MIENIQKMAFKIILSYRYTNYEIACLYFHTTTLELRREKLCRNFANKNLKSENSFFKMKQNVVNTRRKQNIVEELKCRTKRFKNSSIPYMAKLPNK